MLLTQLIAQIHYLETVLTMQRRTVHYTRIQQLAIVLYSRIRPIAINPQIQLVIRQTVP